MKKALGGFALVLALSVSSFAGVWETQCAGCHNGQLAPSKAQLKAKFKTAKDFIDAGRKTSNPMMVSFKGKVLEDAAKELYK